MNKLKTYQGFVSNLCTPANPNRISEFDIISPGRQLYLRRLQITVTIYNDTTGAPVPAAQNNLIVHNFQIGNVPYFVNSGKYVPVAPAIVLQNGIYLAEGGTFEFENLMFENQIHFYIASFAVAILANYSVNHNVICEVEERPMQYG